MDGDGQPEIVSAEKFNQDDVHYMSAVAAHKLDGTVLWRWGDPAIGRKTLHHDVACQIHDWDSDGIPEVLIATRAAVCLYKNESGRRPEQPIPLRTGANLTLY